MTTQFASPNPRIAGYTHLPLALDQLSLTPPEQQTKAECVLPLHGYGIALHKYAYTVARSSRSCELFVAPQSHTCSSPHYRVLQRPFTLRPQAGCPRRGYGATRSLASSTGSPPTFRSHDQPQAPDTTIATCWRRAHVFSSWPPSGRAREAKPMSTIDFRIALKITRTEKTVHALRAVDRFGRARIVSYLVARWSTRKFCLGESAIVSQVPGSHSIEADFARTE